MLFKVERIYRHNQNDKERSRVSVAETYFSSWDKAMLCALDEIEACQKHNMFVDGFNSFNDELVGTNEKVCVWHLTDIFNCDIYDIGIFPIGEGYSYGVLEYGNLS